MKTIEVTIKGVTPLLMNRFSQGSATTDKPRTGVPDWKASAELALYSNDDGLYQPAEHIERSLTLAAVNFKVAGKRGKSYATLVGSSVDIVPDAIPHKIKDYVIDSRPVVVQRARVVRYRPRLDIWELDFSIVLHDDQLPPEVAKQILDFAGLYVGIGDYRPQKRGKFGKFMVTKFEG